MILPDKLFPEGIPDLPAESGDICAPRFEPDDTWLPTASPLLQRAAMWRWFATHYDDPELATPHDEQGHYLYLDGGPYLADVELMRRFGEIVPQDVIRELLASLLEQVGNEWALKKLDKVGG